MSRTIVVVTNIPRPYRQPLFGILREQLAAQNLHLLVLYTSDPSKHLRRGSPSATITDPEMDSYVRGISFRAGYERVVTIPTGLRRALKQSRPLCVLTAGFGADALVSAWWCHAERVPYVLWSGAWPGKEGEVGRLQETRRRRLVRAATAFVAYGTAAADYLVSLGALPDRVFCAWNTVNVEAVASAARAARASRPELTSKYRLAGKNLLFVGSLVERKGLRELVAAALAADPQHADWVLHIVGAGPLRDELEATGRAAAKEALFRFHGLRAAADVAELLGVADGLLLPTKSEVWGLVINEAMACGVPVVASPWAGATRDLIQDGVTGYVVDPDDTLKLSAVISRLVSDDPTCREVGLAGAQAVRAKASLEKSAEGFASAILCAVEGTQDG